MLFHSSYSQCRHVHGSSAGGLDAFKRFFTAMPASSGMAFVLIPHLDPTHKSLMVESLSKQTDTPVRETADGIPIEVDSVYVIPANKYLAISDRRFELSVPTERRGFEMAIDFCFRLQESTDWCYPVFPRAGGL